MLSDYKEVVFCRVLPLTADARVLELTDKVKVPTVLTFRTSVRLLPGSPRSRAPLTNDDATREQGIEGSGLFEQQVGQEHIEHGGERAPHVVEGHPHVLEAEVIEANHADEDYRQRQHTASHLEVQAQGGEVNGARAAGGQSAEALAQQRGHQALKESDEDRGVQLQGGAVQQVLVEEYHGDGDDPVERDHQRDLQRPQQKRLVPVVCIGLLGGNRGSSQRHAQDPGPLQGGPVHGGRRAGSSHDQKHSLVYRAPSC